MSVPNRTLIALCPTQETRRVKIIDSRVAHEGWFKLIIADVRLDDGTELAREFISPRPAAAVMPYDAARGVALLIHQSRPAVIYAGGPQTLMEAAAGLRDGDEDAETCAVREAMEELGVRLTTLERVVDCFPSCGPSAERLTLFLAPYAETDRVAAGGGLASEHEALEVLEIPLQDLWSQALAGEIRDLKTLTLVFALHARAPQLFDVG